WRKVAHEHERAPHTCVKTSTVGALSNVTLHAYQLDPGKGVVYEGAVEIFELRTAHRIRIPGGVNNSSRPIDRPGRKSGYRHSRESGNPPAAGPLPAFIASRDR